MMAKAKDDLLGVCILSARHVANLHPRIILTPYKLLGKSRDYISKTGDRQDDHLRTMNMQVIVLSVTCFSVTCFSLSPVFLSKWIGSMEPASQAATVRG
jgi:hypothetical protein